MQTIKYESCEKTLHSESQIEKRLVTKVVELGGKCYKFTAPSRRHVPDRICILPYGIFALVECKAPGKRMRPAQRALADHLLRLGHSVFLVDSYRTVDDLIERFKGLMVQREMALQQMEQQQLAAAQGPSRIKPSKS